jgi:hypothetical protein
MAVTYALPQIPARPARRVTSPDAEDSASRRLTPYPDPKKAFPLSDDHDDNKSNRAGSYLEEQPSPDRVKPIEINFRRISEKLRGSPSNPPGPIGDRSKRGRKSSLPSLSSSSFDNFASGAGRPRRNGWIISESVKAYLGDLKRLV